MGVYIKGFRKPTYCQECPLTFDYDCMIQHEQRDSLIDQYKHCPLIEVKSPHGRLIDADREIKTMTEIIESNSLTEMGWNQYDFCRRTLKTAPTVIEAEEVE